MSDTNTADPRHPRRAPGTRREARDGRLPSWGTSTQASKRVRLSARHARLEAIQAREDARSLRLGWED